MRYPVRPPKAALIPLVALIVAVAAASNGSVDAATTQEIIGPAGSGAFGTVVLALPNGNIVVSDPDYDHNAVSNVGAVYLYDGGTLALISQLRGSTTDDRIGLSGVQMLSNGNFVVLSPGWDDPVTPAINVGAVTWCSMETGCSNGPVSAANSLVGVREFSSLGERMVELTNGNFVVQSGIWRNPVGPVSSAGAVTWVDGMTGRTGPVTAANSLVGDKNNDRVGDGLGSVVPLTNGDYVVISGNWLNPAVANARGAITWADGNGGTVGAVSAANSFINDLANVSVFDSIVPLTNGNYVIVSPEWRNGAVEEAGAVTWADGDSTMTGSISVANSLVGSTDFDGIGGGSGTPVFGDAGSVVALTNGHYVVASPYWDNPSAGVVNAGAVTWANGNGGTTGAVTITNSLHGGTLHDRVGGSHEPLALSDGNYLVLSNDWTNPNGAVPGAGAATWGNGTTGTTGPVSAVNSLVGEFDSDHIGHDAVALPAGGYVVYSFFYSLRSPVVNNVGAITRGAANGSTVGPVGPSNSMIGETALDGIGSGGVVVLADGDYVISSPGWDNASGGIEDAGAVSWCPAVGACLTPPSAANSIIGGRPGDRVGDFLTFYPAVTALTNGDYVIGSQRWQNPATNKTWAGALTYASGAGPSAFTVSAANSLVGAQEFDQVGGDLTIALPGGHYLSENRFDWDNPAGPIVDAGAVSFGLAGGGTTGLVTANNSVLGQVQFDIGDYTWDDTQMRLVVGRSKSNRVTIFSPDIPPPPEPFDVDCDGFETSVDALAVLRSLAGLTTAPIPALPCDADVNEDDKVDLADSLAIRREVASLPN